MGLSNVLSFNLVADTTPPAVTSIAPADGTTVPPGPGNVKITFSKPLDAATVTTANFQILDASNTPLSLTGISLRANNTVVELGYPALTTGGPFQVVINAPAVTDRAGNALGTANIVSHFSLAGVSVSWVNPAGGFWDDPANWSSGQLPGPNDDVVIDVPGNVTITHRQGNDTIKSLKLFRRVRTERHRQADGGWDGAGEQQLHDPGQCDARTAPTSCRAPAGRV